MSLDQKAQNGRPDVTETLGFTLFVKVLNFSRRFFALKKSSFFCPLLEEGGGGESGEREEEKCNSFDNALAGSSPTRESIRANVTAALRPGRSFH